MKRSMSIIALLTLLFCLVPYMWFILSEKSTNKNMKKTFKDMIKSAKVSLIIQEQWSYKFIGIDKSNNFLVFLNFHSDETSFLNIDLREVDSCQIIKQTRDFMKEKKMEIELQSLHLELTFLTDRDPVSLIFYDSKVEFHEYYELKRAEKWQTLIEKRMLELRLDKIAA